MSRYANKRLVHRTGGGQFSRPPSLEAQGVRICPRDGHFLVPKDERSDSGFINPKKTYDPCPLCGWTQEAAEALVASRPDGAQILMDHETFPLFRNRLSAKAVVCAVYYPWSRGGDGEIQPTPFDSYIPPATMRGLLVVEPDVALAQRVAIELGLALNQRPGHA